MLDDLVLLRVWAAADPARGETRSRVASDLRPVAADSSGSAEAWRTAFAQAVAHRTAAGDLTTGGRREARLILTDRGRQRVQTRFGVTHQRRAGEPARGWAWWRDRHALPLALGGRPAGSAEELRVALLQRFYLPELPVRPSADGLLKTVDLLLAERLGAGQVSLGAFRAAALREWVRQTPPVETAAPADDEARRLPENAALFAATAVAAAYRSPTGRFGGKKVFIAHAWRELLASGQAAPEQSDEFKRRLVRAHTAGQLRLARADLAGAHDPGDVRDSEVEYLGEKFHFVRLD